MVLKNKNSLEKSSDCFQKCIELDPLNYKFYVDKASVMNQLEKYDESLLLLNKSLELNPQCIESYIEKGKLKIKINNLISYK